MNCYNHSTESAVAQCPDCGKGLCVQCTSNYSIPICSSCSKKRINTEKGVIIKELVLTFGFGILLSYFFCQWTNEGHSYPLIHNVITAIVAFVSFAGIISGWKTLTSITSNYFLFLPIFGWILYFIVKLSISMSIGFIMFPIRTFKNVSRLMTLQKIRV